MKAVQFDRIQTDVLIIGSGGTALRAALAAAETGAKPLIVSKGPVFISGATYYNVAEIGAFNVPDGAFDISDDPDEFYWDIMDAAKGVSIPALSRIVADEAIEARNYLEASGMSFKRTEDGAYCGYQACFSQKPRSHIIENHFRPLVDALAGRVKQLGIPTMSGIMIADLVERDGVCVGAVGLSDHGNICVFQAKNVILTSGGASTLFAHNMYPGDITGDGYAMGFRAGAVLANMEFIQAGLGLSYPVVNLLGNPFWEAMPQILNGDGVQFLPRYTDVPIAEVLRNKGKHFPFSVSDSSMYVELAIKKEIERGGGNARGNVYLDFTKSDFKELMSERHPSFKNTWPSAVERFKGYGLDLCQQPIEINNFAHAINGGLLIDTNGETSLRGLFAAGECAAGPHGADRLGGNMSVTCQIFGKRAGECAGKRAGQENYAEFAYEQIAQQLYDRIFSFGISAAALEELRSTLQKQSDNVLLIVRTEKKLEHYLSVLDGYNDLLTQRTNGSAAAPMECLQLQNLITTGKLIAQAALNRKESRGSHYREDYPMTNPVYGHMIILQKSE